MEMMCILYDEYDVEWEEKNRNQITRLKDL